MITATTYLTDKYGAAVVIKVLGTTGPLGSNELISPWFIDTLCKGLVEPGANLAGTLARYRTGQPALVKDLFDRASRALFGV